MNEVVSESSSDDTDEKLIKLQKVCGDKCEHLDNNCCSLDSKEEWEIHHRFCAHKEEKEDVHNGKGTHMVLND